MDKNNGGPAFPNTSEYGRLPQAGMDLRDYFAAKAMQAYITARANVFSGDVGDFDEHLAQWSYETAEAMLRAREST